MSSSPSLHAVLPSVHVVLLSFLCRHPERSEGSLYFVFASLFLPFVFAVILSVAKDPEGINPSQLFDPFYLQTPFAAFFGVTRIHLPFAFPSSRAPRTHLNPTHPASPQQKAVKPPSNETPLQTATIAWHSSSIQPGKIELEPKNQYAAHATKGIDLTLFF
jgi:hypothetical protein